MGIRKNAPPRTAAAEAGRGLASPCPLPHTCPTSVPYPARVAEGHWLSPPNFIVPMCDAGGAGHSRVCAAGERHAGTRGSPPAPPHTHHHIRATPAMVHAARQHAACSRSSAYRPTLPPDTGTSSTYPAGALVDPPPTHADVSTHRSYTMAREKVPFDSASLTARRLRCRAPARRALQSTSPPALCR